MHGHSRRVVFIIDSDETARVTHETILRNEGYQIMSAPDGVRALTLVREQPPDLFLLGGKVGTLSAIRLIQIIKSDPAFQNIPVAVYAPAGDGSNSDQLTAAGARQVITGRVSAHELVRNVVALIGRA